MIIDTLLMITGLTRKAFGDKYGIPGQIIEDWVAGEDEPSEDTLASLNERVLADYAAEYAQIVDMYKSLNMDITFLDGDVLNDYLTRNTCRNGRDVFWYSDADTFICVYVGGRELTETEIERELL